MCRLYSEQGAPVKTEYGESEWFPAGKGVRQESLYLSYISAEHITREVGLDLDPPLALSKTTQPNKTLKSAS